MRQLLEATRLLKRGRHEAAACNCSTRWSTVLPPLLGHSQVASLQPAGGSTRTGGNVVANRSIEAVDRIHAFVVCMRPIKVQPDYSNALYMHKRNKREYFSVEIITEITVTMWVRETLRLSPRPTDNCLIT